MIEQPGNYVSKIVLIRIALPYREYFETSFGREYEKHTYIVIVEANGVEGYAETAAGIYPRYSYESVDIDAYVIDKYIIPSIEKGISTNPNEYIEKVRWIKGYNMAKASIEMALWDLTSKLMGKPLYKVIGGKRKYANVGVSIGLQKDIDTLLSKIATYLEEGYQRIKIKISRGRDIELVEAVRREYPDIPLTVDANGDYGYKDLEYLKKLDEFDLLYIEQPFPYWDLYLHSKLQSIIETKICLDESIYNSYLAREAIDIGAAKVINIKPGRVGGIKESIEIHNISMDKGIGTWIGGMLETGIGRGFNVSLATLPNIIYPSDISASTRYFNRDIVTQPWEIDSKGRMWVREEEGIGVEIDWGYLDKIVIWKKEYRIGSN
ncbi:TPA: o-succinylbenzoate synthase [Candidatus Geothermarchaeota archaeon]|nr:o-succinylbenzoate synthase [Candidatus Geothermarchaeota archaeon]